MKKYTQNDKIEQVTEKTLVVGVDIGSTKQYARAFDYRGRELDHVFCFMDCRSGYELFLDWMQGLRSANGMDKIIVGAEPTGHYWFGLRDFLDAAGIPLVLVNPLHVCRSKELDDNNQTKNDQKDPKVIARKLRNRIARWFKIYFPEYTQAYHSFAAKSSIALLKAACLPEDILQLGADGIVELWRAMKLRAVGKKKAESLLAAAARSTGQKDGAGAARMEMEMLLEDWETLRKRHEKIDEKLGDHQGHRPDHGGRIPRGSRRHQAFRFAEADREAGGACPAGEQLRQAQGQDHHQQARTCPPAEAALRRCDTALGNERRVPQPARVLHDAEAEPVEEEAVRHCHLLQAGAHLLRLADERHGLRQQQDAGRHPPAADGGIRALYTELMKEKRPPIWCRHGQSTTS